MSEVSDVDGGILISRKCKRISYPQVPRLVKESTTLKLLLSLHLSSADSNGVRLFELQNYCSTPISDLIVLIKKIDSPANNPRYFKIDTDSTLRRVLSGKTLIEFPTFIVYKQIPLNMQVVEDAMNVELEGEDSPPAQNKVAMSMRIYRSVWGFQVPPPSWSDLLSLLKSQGFDGVEASLGDIGPDIQSFQNALQSKSLELILGVYTSWQDYEGPFQHANLDSHLNILKYQLTAAKSISPQWINIHAGEDSWDAPTIDDFFSKTSAILSELGISNVSFETHRGRVFYSPWNTLPWLEKFPFVNLTLDLSHWVVVCERLLDSKDDEWIWEKFIPRVRHIHGRIGTQQSSQVSDPADPFIRTERTAFERVWKLCILDAQRRNETSSFTIEYGPSPYTPIVPFTESPVSDVNQIILNELASLKASNWPFQ
ncbi:hypothetical protein HK098_004250 [Nowakowskiella sp. JEL0407]|nr:hypothetical protein HK098_004250 [Nowakowskiella sp. JEL0407]